MTTEQPKEAWCPRCRKWFRDWRYFFQFLLALGAVATIVLAGIAFWQGRAAIQESAQMRFADNLPALIIRGLKKEGTKVPVGGVSVVNVGKGPATLILIGLRVEGTEYEHDAPNREYLTASTVPTNFIGDNFNILAEKYAQQRRSSPPSQSNPSPKMEYYVQYADIFENEYRQYFYYAPGDVAPGRFERIAKDSAEYKPVRKPPKDDEGA